MISPRTVLATAGLVVTAAAGTSLGISVSDHGAAPRTVQAVQTVTVPVATALDHFQAFVADMQASSFYAKWASQNRGELARWQGFRDALIGGSRPPAPAMTTRFGAGLVDAGLVYLDATVTPLPEPPPVPPGTTVPTTATTPTTTAPTTTAPTTTTAPPPTTTAPPTTTTAPPPTGTVYFDGRAKRMSQLVSLNTTTQYQTPNLWACLCFSNNDISLAPDGRYGQVYAIRVGPGSHNPYWTPGSGVASSELSVVRPNDVGKWDWFANSYRVDSALTGPSWVVLMQFGYPTLSSPPLAVDMVKVNGVLNFSLYRNAGKLTMASADWAKGTVFEEPTIMPVPQGKWVEIIVGVKWATDATGEIKVYTRTEGETAWTLRVTRTGTPTEQYGTTIYGSVSPDFHESPTVTDHGGLYYGYNDARSSYPFEYVRQSGLTRSSDFATAEGTLP